MRIEVVVPWRGGCPHRERAWDWIWPRYRWPIALMEAPPGDWCKAAAVMPAISQSSADIVIVADADVWTDGLQEAIDAVTAGAGWAIPHRGVFRLTEASTVAVLDGGPLDHDLPLDQRPYTGIEGGGYVVARPEVLLDVPMDHRFKGWGQEDESWALALRALVGPPWRGRAPLWHLWHPPQPRDSRRVGSRENWQLHRQYHRAARRPDAMRALVDSIQPGASWPA